MTVLRIVANLLSANPAETATFYKRLFDLDVVMDQGWIATLASTKKGPVQVSFAAEGGSGTPLPGLSIEVDDLGETLERAKSMGLPIEYGPKLEPWGITRFFIRDPLGTLLNILSHSTTTPGQELEN